MDDNFKWRTGRSCVFKNFVHLVFITKYRRGVFSECILERLNEIFKETCHQMGAELLDKKQVRSMILLVDLLTEIPPQML
jgi:putative transposase